MNIEQFVAQTEGEWRSMRSAHSLAFQQFEDVLSEISVERIDKSDSDLQAILKQEGDLSVSDIESPFLMKWAAESDWEPDDPNDVASGQCIIVPIPNNQQSGVLLRSVGYAESIAAKSEYNFLDDGTFVLKTRYDQSIAEERIWFVSENVRCRSSVLKTSEGSGILQTSFSSEVRRLVKS
ncbi:phycobiliprotein lyase [Synechococcus sp. CC9311]|uniref:phycobiliprotein lyase n=1 Tax=Synechococcus sp. (strain CC9311) TaxID=64471 RepID=UPI0000DDAB03|nr:phycobiliprotein lyase [Synechococcus sp. CC9311]ABI45963.1 phycoerythrin linker protein CpeS [Synechococcus sp. CC9311]